MNSKETKLSVIRHPLRIVFMGTPAFALPTLAALQASGHEIVAVYTQPPRPAGRGQKEMKSPVHEFALAHNLPVYTPTNLKTPETQAEFAALKADIAVVVAYGLLLPQPILAAYKYGCVNIHPSALPRFRGAAPIQRTIMAGDTKTAIVIMQMNAGLDTGDMLAIEEFDIEHGTNAGKLHDILAEKAAPLLLKTLDNLANITPQKQPEIGVTYAKKITKDDQKIDWKKPACEIYQQILGLAPTQGAIFSYNGEAIKVFDAEFVMPDADFSHEIASDIKKSSDVASSTKERLDSRLRGNDNAGVVADQNLGITCGDGKTLRPLTLQRPNKKRMNVEEFLRGFEIPAGTILE